jgi:hypothetical protein
MAGSSIPEAECLSWTDNPLESAIKRLRAFIDLDLAGRINEALELFGVIRLWLGFAWHSVIGANTGMLRQWPQRGCQVPIATAIADAARPTAGIRADIARQRHRPDTLGSALAKAG